MHHQSTLELATKLYICSPKPHPFQSLWTEENIEGLAKSRKEIKVQPFYTTGSISFFFAELSTEELA